jgi:hypothetical protein
VNAVAFDVESIAKITVSLPFYKSASENRFKSKSPIGLY